MLVGHSEIALIAEFRDRFSDRVVQAAIERAKFVDFERGIALVREVRNRLAKVAVVMDKLVN